MKTRKHIVSIIFFFFLALLLGFLAVSEHIGLGEGTLILSISRYLNSFADNLTGFFHSGSLSQFSLVPAALTCLILAFTLMSPNPLLRCVLIFLFYSGLYLISAYCQGTKGFGVASLMGSPADLYTGAFMSVFSVAILAAVLADRKKSSRSDGKVKDNKQSNEKTIEDAEGENHIEASVDMPKSSYVPAQDMNVPDAVGMLRVVSVPSFMRFPAEIKDKVLRDDIDDSSTGTEGFFRAVGKEKRIRKKDKNHVSGDDSIEQAVPVKTISDDLFDLKNLRTAFEQDRAAVEAFPKAGYQNGVFSQMDAAFDPKRRTSSFASERIVMTPMAMPRAEIKSPVKTPKAEVIKYDYSEPMKYSVRESGFSDPLSVSPSEYEEVMPMEVRASESQDLMAASSYGDVVMPIYVENTQVPHTVFQEAEKADSMNSIETTVLDLEASDAPRVLEIPQAPRILNNRDVSDFENEQIISEIPGEPDDSEIDEAARRYARMVNSQESGGKNQDSKMDIFSGVAGLSGNGSYLINAKKYEYVFPKGDLLKHYEVSSKKEYLPEDDPDGKIIVDTLRQFRIETRLLGVQRGPTFTLYQLALAKGIRVNSVLNLAENIAMDLAVDGVRILAPIPGKPAIGVEVPNKKRDTIGFDIMYPALMSKSLKIPFVLGKTITGESIVIDLAGTPHLLIAGTTGSGKSVSVNSLICSVLFTKKPDEVRMMLVDPKMVELSVYNGIPHLLTPVITQPKRAIKGIAFIISEMERRMAMFQKCGVKKIEDYNKKVSEGGLLAQKLPYIMVIIDEFADLMMVVGKELESYIQRITQIARFTGIHLVLATQRPSVDVITGIIKSNIPSRIAFAVSDATNSKIILDSIGAEKLLGRGDMLYLSSTSPNPQRIQGAYIDPEIEQIVSVVKQNGEPNYIDESYFEDEDDDSSEISASSSDDGGDLFTRAWKLVTEKGEASASYLQRKLGIGYNRAATLIEKLEDAGYIGPARGAKPREILRCYISQENETT